MYILIVGVLRKKEHSTIYHLANLQRFLRSCNRIVLTTFLYRFQKITEEAQNMNRMLGDRLIQIDSNILLDPIKGRKFWETLKINQNISIKFFDREPDMADFIISFYIWQWKKNIFLTLFCNCKFSLCCTFVVFSILSLHFLLAVLD